MSEHKIYPTPLLSKIGYKEENRVALIDAPDWIKQLLVSAGCQPYNHYMGHVGLDIIWIFTNRQAVLENHLYKVVQHIHRSGMIWITWYKKSSKLASQLTEDKIRDSALALNLVDIKVLIHRSSMVRP
jgi:hypothetical protein